jgi:hypothetical protein
VKILERYDQTKTVVAWGETWHIKHDTQWLMINENGTIAVSYMKPWVKNGKWVVRKGKVNPISKVRYRGDWRESLVYVGEQ